MYKLCIRPPGSRIEGDMEKKRGTEWMTGLSMCIFLPMAVNLIVLAIYVLGAN